MMLYRVLFYDNDDEYEKGSKEGRKWHYQNCMINNDSSKEKNLLNYNSFPFGHNNQDQSYVR